MSVPILYKKSPYLRNAQVKTLWDGVSASAKGRPPLSLTLSGNEVTRDGELWVEEATTNFIPNSSFATNTTGWSAAGTNTITRVSVASEGIPAPFSGVTHVGKLTFGNSQYGVQAALTVLSATLHTGSVYLYVPSSTSNGPFAIWCDGFTGGSGSANVINMSARDQWQRATTQRTPDAGDLSGTLLLYANTGTYTVGDVIYIFGAQVENQPIATSLVPTDGGTATRNAGRLQAVFPNLDETQGWFSCRLRMGWGVTGEIGATAPMVFHWGDNGTDRIILYYLESDNSWRMQRQASGVGSATGAITSTHASGGLVTLTGFWTATQVGLSVNGSVFTTVADTNIPTLSDTAADLGSQGTVVTGRQIDAGFLWAAYGTGTLTNADAAYMYDKWLSDPVGLLL